VFLEWATLQTKKLIKPKILKMGGLTKEVRQRLGYKTRAHSPKGDLLPYIRDAKGDFLMAACFTWRQSLSRFVISINVASVATPPRSTDSNTTSLTAGEDIIKIAQSSAT